jgi:hypothetical protein
MRNYLWIAVVLPLLAAAPANACKVVGHASDGEPLCETTSDGAAQPYTDGRHDGGYMNSNVHKEVVRHRAEKIKGLLNWMSGMGRL